MREGGRPVEGTDSPIERGSKRELETEMKRNEVRQRESRGEGVEERKVSDKRDEGERVCVCVWVGGGEG